MSTRFISLVLIMMTWPTLATAGVRRIWVVNDGEKIERDATNHPASAGNSAWDGRVGRVFGARNEIVAFQVIVEADAKGIGALSVRLNSLASSSDRIVYRPPALDPTDYAGRPIQIFAERYMNVTTPSHASWGYHRMAHRFRVEFVHAYDERTLPGVWGRFSGDDFTRERGYEGPGEGKGNVIAPRTFYGPGRDFDDRASAWTQSDAWMTFLRDK